MAARRSAPLSDTFDPSALAEAQKRLHEAGSLLVSKLEPKGLSRTGKAAFAEALARAGFERTGTRVRVPVAQQLVARLSSDGSLPVKGIQKRIAGAKAAELGRAIARLVSAGQAVVVMHDGEESLRPASGEFLSASQLDALKTMIAWVKPRKGKPPRTLLRADVAAAIAVQPSVAPVVTSAQRVLDALRDATDDRTGLVRVPDAVRGLLGEMSAGDACAALLQLHAEGRIELRPESGVGLLSEQEAALCPRGARGVVLSFARLLSPGAQ